MECVISGPENIVSNDKEVTTCCSYHL